MNTLLRRHESPIYGLGVEKSYEEAAKWFRKAADYGDVRAQWHLGLMYANFFGAYFHEDWHCDAETPDAISCWRFISRTSRDRC